MGVRGFAQLPILAAVLLAAPSLCIAAQLKKFPQNLHRGEVADDESIVQSRAALARQPEDVNEDHQWPGTVLFVGGLEATGHHLVQAVLADLPGVYSYNVVADASWLPYPLLPDLWRACTSGAPTPTEELERMRSRILRDVSRGMASRGIKLKQNSGAYQPPLLLLNTAEFMASYPDRRLTKAAKKWFQGKKGPSSPNATCLQEVFAGSSLGFKVLQLERQDLMTLIEHGERHSGHNTTRHAHVLATEGNYLADQLETIPESNRMCLHTEKAGAQGLSLEAFLGRRGVHSAMIKNYNTRKGASDRVHTVPDGW
eukprot:CAMPEP_0178378902 /NCGR_PEP_ID=MMETSP0689_2-20121128/4666_1 /TAXON_ID=160604 /ORGANISM="Amphidinium massartii, Strain CS-259" /LENGTH=312 /DNA_ID=CAMNT_0019998987 /DNA_START=175 /DNA_END=1110 /DNA_ORIENTATION=+